jgi:protein-disulfide isomerase
VGSASCNGPENCNHKACVKEKGAFGGNTFQCKEVPSPGENGCETYSDCPEEEDPILPNVGNQNLGLPIPKVQPAPKVLPGAAIKILKTKMYQATIGASTAPVTVAVFQDLKCGMCKKAGKEVLPNLIKEYVDTGKVKVQFFEFPLGNAKIENELANAALCAHEQKKYVSYLNKLYEDMKTTKVEDVSIYAKELGLDTKAFNKCVSQKSHMKDIKKHVEVGKKLFVNGTPTFFVNGKEMRGAKPYDLFKVAIEKELSQNRRRFTKELTTGAKSEVQDKVAKEK